MYGAAPIKKVIESLLKTKPCGKQGLPLHGHRDDKIDRQASEAGNHKLVHFRAETDPVLA